MKTKRYDVFRPRLDLSALVVGTSYLRAVFSHYVDFWFSEFGVVKTVTRNNLTKTGRDLFGCPCWSEISFD